MKAEERQWRLSEAIKATEDKDGHAIPKRVVEAARNPSNFLHKEFEWDDSVAAQLQREDRARELIREVRVMVIKGEKRVAVPTYVSDPRTTSSSYVRTASIARSSPTKRMVMQAEIDQIRRLIERAMGLAVVFGLQDRFENALNEIVEAGVDLGSRDDDGYDDDDGRRPSA
jgi:hypothetical protein